MDHEHTKVLLEAISWSNANMWFDDPVPMDDSVARGFVNDLLRGLDHFGWTLTAKT